MVKKTLVMIALAASAGLTAAQGPGSAARGVALGDWPEARGPNRDGISKETGLPEKWALNGQNFLWRVPYGGRSAPIVMGNRVYVQNPSGRGPDLQERVMALDADTGKVVWEYKFNIFQSDVPPHRVGWASPAADPETGNIYVMGVGATVIALNKDGKRLWDRSIGEEFAVHRPMAAGRCRRSSSTASVIVSSPISSWEPGGASHRFVALDKRTGDIMYVASPGGRPYDTAYAMPTIATINGLRLLICGTGDGAVHAMKPQTGERVWSYVASKRAINTGVAVSGTSVIVSHGDENLDSSELGMIAAIDGSQTGDIKAAKWAVKGDQFGFSSPSSRHRVSNRERRQMKAFDLNTAASCGGNRLG
jgi:outer membrane protein assembly factor BamB